MASLRYTQKTKLKSFLTWRDVTIVEGSNPPLARHATTNYLSESYTLNRGHITILHDAGNEAVNESSIQPTNYVQERTIGSHVSNFQDCNHRRWPGWRRGRIRACSHFHCSRIAHSWYRHRAEKWPGPRPFWRGLQQQKRYKSTSGYLSWGSTVWYCRDHSRFQTYTR